jgi:hypothetical protein
MTTEDFKKEFDAHGKGESLDRFQGRIQGAIDELESLRNWINKNIESTPETRKIYFYVLSRLQGEVQE